MRPGQAAPEFGSGFASGLGVSGGFNEAGAGCPGIRKQGGVYANVHPEASMRPGQAAPEFDGGF